MVIVSFITYLEWNMPGASFGIERGWNKYSGLFFWSSEALSGVWHQLLVRAGGWRGTLVMVRYGNALGSGHWESMWLRRCFFVSFHVLVSEVDNLSIFDFIKLNLGLICLVCIVTASPTWRLERSLDLADSCLCFKTCCFWNARFFWSASWRLSALGWDFTDCKGRWSGNWWT